MAIVEELGLGAVVMVDGQPLMEYTDIEPKPLQGAAAEHTIARHHYIEAQDDKEFVVSVSSTRAWESEQPDFVLRYCIYVDGKWARSSIAQKDDLRRGYKSNIKGAREYPPGVDYSLLRKFQFSSITTVDDADKQKVQEDTRATKHTGSIQVSVFRALAALGADPRDHSATRSPLSTSLCIAEKALKGQAISHSTSYAPPVRNHRPRHVSVRRLDPYPIAMFSFKYRSRAAPQAEMIIPRPPSQAAEDDGLDIDALSVDELRKIAKKQRQEIKEGKRTKSEGSRAVKRELNEIVDLTDDIAGPQVRKIPRTSAARTIDLTADPPPPPYEPSPNISPILPVPS